MNRYVYTYIEHTWIFLNLSIYIYIYTSIRIHFLKCQKHQQQKPYFGVSTCSKHNPGNVSKSFENIQKQHRPINRNTCTSFREYNKNSEHASLHRPLHKCTGELLQIDALAFLPVFAVVCTGRHGKKEHVFVS